MSSDNETQMEGDFDDDDSVKDPYYIPEHHWNAHNEEQDSVDELVDSLNESNEDIQSSPTINRSQRAKNRNQEKELEDFFGPKKVKENKQKLRKDKRKTSEIWNHFIEVRDKHGQLTHLKCKHCPNKQFCYTSSTSTPNAHLKREHSDILIMSDAYSGVTSSSSASHDPLPPSKSQKTVKQSSMNVYVHKSIDDKPYPRNSDKCKHLDRWLGRMIVKDLRPLDDCCSEGFVNFMKECEPRYEMPSPITLKNNVLYPMEAATKKVLKDMLSKVDSASLTTDGWTSLASDSFLTITCHMVEPETMQLLFFVLDTVEMNESHTSINLVNKITGVLKDWGINEKKLVFVSDNASDITKAVAELGGCPWLGCMGHNINLVIQQALKEPNVKQLLDHLKK